MDSIVTRPLWGIKGLYMKIQYVATEEPLILLEHNHDHDDAGSAGV